MGDMHDTGRGARRVRDPVSVRHYRMDARRFEGPLNAPRRNDSEQHESDDLAALVEIARGLVAEGYTTWIYERVRRAQPLPVAYDLRLVSRLDPGTPRG